MSKRDTSYSDAMNEWAAKQSFLRNRKNRLIHPNPELPVLFQAIGYAFRVLIVVFIVSLIVSKLSTKYYTGPGFNEEFKEQLQTFVKAEELEATTVVWQRDKASIRKVSGAGSDAAFYRDFEAIKVSYRLPLLKRLRKQWNIDELLVDRLKMDLKSGGKMQGEVGMMDPEPASELMVAGLFPSANLAEATIEKVICSYADLSWGLSSATKGGVEGGRLELYSGTPNWRMDLSGAKLRQNWMRDVLIESVTVRRDGKQLAITNGVVQLGEETEPGTLEGNVTLERLPKLDLNLTLPEVSTRDMIPATVKIPEFFYGVLDLSVNFSGSINTQAGVETRATGKVLSGAFSKIPVFEAVDKVLKTSRFRILSIAEGEFEFSTSGGKLNVTNFLCKSKGGSTAVRGNFVFIPAVTSTEAAVANEDALGTIRLEERNDDISGKIYLGVWPKLIEGNELAAKYFTESSDGYVWIEIPLDGPIGKATKQQQAELLSAARSVK